MLVSWQQLHVGPSNSRARSMLVAANNLDLHVAGARMDGMGLR